MTKNFDIDQMRARLTAALKERGLSKRGTSLKANLNPGFIHGILIEGKEPTIANLAQVCEAIGVSLSYIIYGYEITPETERLLRLIEEHPEKRDLILGLLR